MLCLEARPENQTGKIMKVEDTNVDRRVFLAAAGGVALATAAGSANAKTFSGAAYSELALAARECSASGSACISECIADLRNESLMLVECLARLQELVASCDALAKMATLGTKHLVAFAAVTKEVCAYCEEECRKHEDHHPSCGECAASCVECAQACERVIGSA